MSRLKIHIYNEGNKPTLPQHCRECSRNANRDTDTEPLLSCEGNSGSDCCHNSRSSSSLHFKGAADVRRSRYGTEVNLTGDLSFDRSNIFTEGNVKAQPSIYASRNDSRSVCSESRNQSLVHYLSQKLARDVYRYKSKCCERRRLQRKTCPTRAQKRTVILTAKNPLFRKKLTRPARGSVSGECLESQYSQPPILSRSTIQRQRKRRQVCNHVKCTREPLEKYPRQGKATQMCWAGSDVECKSKRKLLNHTTWDDRRGDDYYEDAFLDIRRHIAEVMNRPPHKKRTGTCRNTCNYKQRIPIGVHGSYTVGRHYYTLLHNIRRRPRRHKGRAQASAGFYTDTDAAGGPPDSQTSKSSLAECEDVFSLSPSSCEFYISKSPSIRTFRDRRRLVSPVSRACKACSSFSNKDSVERVEPVSNGYDSDIITCGGSRRSPVQASDSFSTGKKHVQMSQVSHKRNSTPRSVDQLTSSRVRSPKRQTSRDSSYLTREGSKCRNEQISSPAGHSGRQRDRIKQDPPISPSKSLSPRNSHPHGGSEFDTSEGKEKATPIIHESKSLKNKKKSTWNSIVANDQQLDKPVIMSPMSEVYSEDAASATNLGQSKHTHSHRSPPIDELSFKDSLTDEKSLSSVSIKPAMKPSFHRKSRSSKSRSVRFNVAPNVHHEHSNTHGDFATGNQGLTRRKNSQAELTEIRPKKIRPYHFARPERRVYYRNWPSRVRPSTSTAESTSCEAVSSRFFSNYRRLS